jgi:hypothetical protein
MPAPMYVADVILHAGDELILVVCRDLGAAAAARNDNRHVPMILIPPTSMQQITGDPVTDGMWTFWIGVTVLRRATSWAETRAFSSESASAKATPQFSGWWRW